MSIQQYRCKKHPKLTRRASHPDKLITYNGWKDELVEKIIYKRVIPKCPICREPMEIYTNKDKGNKYYDGVCTKIDENFKKKLTWCIKKGKKV